MSVKVQGPRYKYLKQLKQGSAFASEVMNMVQKVQCYKSETISTSGEIQSKYYMWLQFKDIHYKINQCLKIWSFFCNAYVEKLEVVMRY